MSSEIPNAEQNRLTLCFEDAELEKAFRHSYNQLIKIPLRYGIIISVISWYSGIGLIYAIIPEKFEWLSVLTLIYIGSFFGFIIYATFKKGLEPYYHIIGACSNAWAGLYAIYFCDQFPNGVHLILPTIIFIIFFGSYMVRLRWVAGCIAALTYVIAYHIFIYFSPDLSSAQVMLYAFVAWMTLIFAVLAGRVAETNTRIAFIQSKTIEAQRVVIEKEKELLLQEVHHRVKNNLQIIVSLIKLQLTKLKNDESIEALSEAKGRILAMSLVHQRINHTSNFGHILLLDYIKSLIENVSLAHDAKNNEWQLDIPDDTSIDIDTAIPVGLIMNEIISNFYKHQYNETNTVRSFNIQTVKLSENTVSINYTDNGEGFPEHVLTKPADSLGLELIQSLADQIDAEFKFYNDHGAVYQFQINTV